jgi:hypothetical protein
MTIIRDVKKLDNFSSIEKKIAIGLFSILWIFLFIRAINVPVLHDEIATFFYYVQSDTFMPPNAHWDANNHVLNSMLSNWSYHLFGQSPLALRLPNVLSFLLLFYAAYGISARLKTASIRWGLLTALTMSTYIFEYLGECRGYGISMSLLLLSVYFVIRLIETNQTKYILFTGILLFFGTSANLTLLISSVLLFGFMFIHSFIQDYQYNKKRLMYKTITLLITGLPFMILAKLSFKLKELGLLWYGSLDGFRNVTVPSLSERFFGFYNEEVAILLAAISLFILAIIVMRIIKEKKWNKLVDGHSLFAYLFLGTIAMILLLAKLLEVNYPEDRAAMYLYFYFIGGFAFTLDSLTNSNKLAQFGSIFLYFFSLTFIFSTGLSSSTFSSEERHSQEIFDYIHQQENDFKFPITVGGYRTQELCWYYMVNSSGGKEGRLHWSNHPGLDADYQIVSTTHFFNPKTYAYYDSIMKDPATGLVLFERKNKLKKNLIDVRDFPDVKESSIDFYNFGKYEVDTLQGELLYIGAELTLTVEKEPFNAWISVGYSDEKGESLGSEYIALDWLQKKWDGEENNLVQGTLIHEIPKGAKTMTFYIWNIEQVPFSIRDGKCYLYLLEKDY